jgi:hypothetical protein
MKKFSARSIGAILALLKVMMLIITFCFAINICNESAEAKDFFDFWKDITKPSSPTIEKKDNSFKLPSTNIGTGYIQGANFLRYAGHCTVEVDNTRNNYPVLVTLFHLPLGYKAYPIRTFSIRQGSAFTAENIDAGLYDVRYEIIDTGNKYKTESFSLKEVRTYSGVSFSAISPLLLIHHTI